MFYPALPFSFVTGTKKTLSKKRGFGQLDLVLVYHLSTSSVLPLSTEVVSGAEASAAGVSIFSATTSVTVFSGAAVSFDAGTAAVCCWG
jgi:hypothetical protein